MGAGFQRRAPQNGDLVRAGQLEGAARKHSAIQLTSALIQLTSNHSTTAQPRCSAYKAPPGLRCWCCKHLCASTVFGSGKLVSLARPLRAQCHRGLAIQYRVNSGCKSFLQTAGGRRVRHAAGLTGAPGRSLRSSCPGRCSSTAPRRLLSQAPLLGATAVHERAISPASRTLIRRPTHRSAGPDRLFALAGSAGAGRPCSIAGWCSRRGPHRRLVVLAMAMQHLARHRALRRVCVCKLLLRLLYAAQRLARQLDNDRRVLRI